MSNIKKEVVEELHKPARRKFKRRRVIIKCLNDLIQADLVEMIPYAKNNKGFRYILVVINVFSKYVWAEPVKRKTAKDVTHAMKKILSQMKIKPKNLQTDLGKEFYNKEFESLIKSEGINHYSTFSILKASVVERVNRTLKSIMWKQFSLQGSYKWLNLLPKIVMEYNNRVHNTIGMKPKDVTKKNENLLLKSVYNHIKTMDSKPSKFKTGDYVRISKHREAFSKGYTPNWSNEVFKVRKVNFTNPTTYLLEDENKTEIQGTFYSEELLKVKYPDIYLVEKIIRRKDNKVFVKWLGLDNRHNSWINKSNVL